MITLPKIKNSLASGQTPLLFSNRDLFKIVIPLLLTQVLGILVGTIDTIMVSYAGEAAVSGVSLVTTLDVLLIVLSSALVGGGGVVLSQTLGRKNYTDVYEVAKQLLYIVTILGTALMTIAVLFGNPLLSLFFGEVDAPIMQSAQKYFFFLALSYPFLALTDGTAACFRASGNTRIPFLQSILINLINVGFNALFIYGFGMGAMGAAIATLIARIVGATIGLLWVLNPKYEIHVEHLLHYRPRPLMIRQILRIGVPNGIENGMFQFGRLLTQALISTLGATAIAANAIALNICNFQYLTGNALSAAMLTIVGICIGSGKIQQAKYYSRRLLWLNYLILWTIILLTLLFIRPLLSMYNLTDASEELAKQLIIYHAICGAIVWPIGFMLPSAFRAAGDVRFSMIVSVSTMWIFRVIGAYFFALESVSVLGWFVLPGLGLGIAGVWIAMTVDWLFRAILFIVYYCRGTWLTKKSIALDGND